MKTIEIVQIIMVIISASYFFASSFYVCAKMDDDEFKFKHLILYIFSWFAVFGITALTFYT